jgi:hypothetical protein
MAEMHNYLKPLPRHTVKLLALALLAIAISAWLAVHGQAEREKAAALMSSEKALRTANKPKAAPKLSKLQTEDLKRWNALKTERSFDWKPVFAAVERAGNADIELLAFQPDKAGRRIILRGEGKDGLAVVEFIERLGAQKVLKDVHLTRQKSTQRGRLTTI